MTVARAWSRGSACSSCSGRWSRQIPLDEATWFPGVDRAAARAGDRPAPADPGRRRRARGRARFGGSSSRRSASSAGRPRAGRASAAPSRSSPRSRCCRSRWSVLRVEVRDTGLAFGLVGVAFGGVIVGIVLVGPWLTYLVGRALHALPGGASMLLASRRLTDDPSRLVRGDRRRDHGRLRRERVLLVRGLREGAGLRPGRRPRRGPGLSRDAVQRRTAVRRGSRPDRGRAGRPFRARDRERRARGGRPAHRLGGAMRRRRAAVRARRRGPAASARSIRSAATRRSSRAPTR